MTPEQSKKAVELIRELLKLRHNYYDDERGVGFECTCCGSRIPDDFGSDNDYCDIKCKEDCVGEKAEKFLKELEESSK